MSTVIIRKFHGQLFFRDFFVFAQQGGALNELTEVSKSIKSLKPFPRPCIAKDIIIHPVQVIFFDSISPSLNS